MIELPRMFPKHQVDETVDKRVEVFSPSEWQQKVSRVLQPDSSADQRVRNFAEKSGSIVGGAVAGFTKGVAKQTIAPIVSPIAERTGAAARGTVSFLKAVLIGIFVIAFAIIGLFALIVIYMPRK